MFTDVGNTLLVGSILLLISVLAGKTLKRLGIPTLIFFLVIGILAGSEGIGGIHFDNAALSQFIGIVALNFILFSGGLDTNWQSIKPVLWRGVAYLRSALFSPLFPLVFLFIIFLDLHWQKECCWVLLFLQQMPRPYFPSYATKASH